MPRLLFIAERFPPDIGGVSRSASRIISSLVQLGLEVDVVVWSRFLQPGEVKLETSKTHVYRLGLYRHWDMTMLHTLNVLEGLQSSQHYDAVWGHYLFPAGFLAVWFAQLNGLPSTVSARGNDVDRALFPPGDFARLQWTLERATVVTSVSQDIRRKIQVLVKRDEVLVIQNAVDSEIFAPAVSGVEKQQVLDLKQSLGIAEEELVMGFSGELREKKGQHFLLKALTRVRCDRPACLLIIGEVRTTQEAVLQVFAHQFPEDAQRLIITGHLTEPLQVAKYLRLCDTYLQPSIWEGLPNSLLEAMACGLGCIASDAGGIPEMIETGQTGFILPRNQLHNLGEAVLEWCRLEEAVKTRIQIKARDRILQNYSLTQELSCLQQVIARLIPNWA